MRVGRDPYTAAHELGHLLMPKMPSGEHFTIPSTIATPGARHFPELNLMADGAGKIENAKQTKRIWDGSDGDGDRQHLSLDISGFLR